MPTALDQSAIDDLMAERDIAVPARQLVTEAVETVSKLGVVVEGRASQGHISLVVPGRAVAVFIHQRRFSLTFDKAVAVDLAQRYPICDLQNEASKTTGHVRVTYDRLRDPRWTAIVRDLLVEALQRSLGKNAAQVTGRADAPPVAPPATQCPVHQQAMFGGLCHLCD